MKKQANKEKELDEQQYDDLCKTVTRRVHVNQKKEREAYGKIFSKTFVNSPVNSANTTQILSGSNTVAGGYQQVAKRDS